MSPTVIPALVYNHSCWQAWTISHPDRCMWEENWFLPSGNINEIPQHNSILLQKTEQTACLDWQELYFFSKNEIDFFSLSPQILLPDHSIPATSSPGHKPRCFHSVGKLIFCRGAVAWNFGMGEELFSLLWPASHSDELQHLLQNLLAGVKAWARRWTYSWVHNAVSLLTVVPNATLALWGVAISISQC